jgi:hypothetical protein
LPTQIEVCKEFISEYDVLTLTKVYSEDNVSGMFTDNRTEYLAMLEGSGLNAAGNTEEDEIIPSETEYVGEDVYIPEDDIEEDDIIIPPGN